MCAHCSATAHSSSARVLRRCVATCARGVLTREYPFLFKSHHPGTVMSGWLAKQPDCLPAAAFGLSHQRRTPPATFESRVKAPREPEASWPQLDCQQHQSPRLDRTQHHNAYFASSARDRSDFCPACPHSEQQQHTRVVLGEY